jgi:hypothetical protein
VSAKVARSGTIPLAFKLASVPGEGTMLLGQTERQVLETFERGLDPRHPESSQIPAKILGYGEISTVFGIQVEGMEDLAFKRLPLFRDPGEVERYRAAYEEYNRLLQDDIGLRLPAHSCIELPNDAQDPILYIIQRQLPAASIGHKALHLLERGKVLLLVRRALQEMSRVWDFNQHQDHIQVALDGQISNWSIAGFDAQRPHLDQNTALAYLDTSTPLFRVEGVEQLDPELFLRSAPSFLAWILRLFFVKDVVNRYYDFHQVAVDLVANFYKEQRPDLIGDVIAEVNSFFEGEAADLRIEPLTEEEVRAYYREDALIWTLYLSMRRLDRTIRTRLLRQPYPYILPGRIER